MQAIQFIEVLSGIGAGKLGSEDGVKWLTKQQQLSPLLTFENQVESQFLTPPAKYIDNLTAFFQGFSQPLQAVYQSADFPVILSGDHSNAIGTVSAFLSANPDKHVGIIWIDAHADLHTPYTTPSGNLHGMSLAALIREDNQACAEHYVGEMQTAYWNGLKNLTSHTKGILPKDICFLGLRDYEPAEAALLEKYDISHYSTQKMREVGFDAVFEAVNAQFAEVDLLYVSFDVDSLDSALLNATGTPVEQGFTEKELAEILEAVLALPNLAVFELTEFNPNLSEDTAQYALVSRLFALAVARISQKNG